MKKTIKTLIMFLVVTLATISIVKVDAITSAPEKITVDGVGYLENYIGTTQFAIKATLDGTYAYCLDKHLNTPTNMVMTLQEQKDAGVAYIMMNGYPNKSITGNKNYDYYITQTALWWYLDETTGSDNLNDAFKTGQDKHDLRKHVIKLKDEALKAKDVGYVKPELNLISNTNNFTIEGDYYYSSEITVSTKATTGNITLSLKNAPNEAKIINANGKEVTSVSSGAKIRIQIPKTSVNELSTTIKLNASTTSKVDKAYMYKPESNKHQPVVVSILFSETNSISTSKEFTLKTIELNVIKKDKETDNVLEGATFVLKDINGNEITTWISGSKPYTIKNLPEGEYVIEELNAPEGYIKSDEKVKVKLENGKPVTISFYNIREVIEYSSSIKISKINGETNSPLAGASLILKDNDGNVVSSWVTTTAEYEVKNVKPGTYYLSEEKAPEGFVLSKEVIEIIVPEDGGTVIVTFYNIPKVEVPNTLTNSSVISIIAGIVTTIIGGSIIYITLRKEENFE